MNVLVVGCDCQAVQVFLMNTETQIITLADRASEMDAEIAEILRNVEQECADQEPRNRKERRANQFKHPTPRYGQPAWKGNR